MSNNIENDRSNSTGKMYPIDLAPQKITIVKSMSNTEVKMAHLITGQSKTSGSGQLITHAGSVGLMRSTAQIITPGVSSQPQMIVSGPPIFQGTPIISQGSQLLGQTSQIITQSQIINSSGIISPGTQIISQGSQLSAQVSNSSNSVSNIQSSVASSISGTQVLNVGGQLVSGSGNLVVSSSVRTIPPSVRVLPPLPHNRPVLSSVNVSTASGVLVSKAVTSHVPRGLAAGASLAVRPVTPIAASQSAGNQGGGAWSSGKGRSALVYQGRGVVPRGAAPRAPTATPPAASPTPTPVSTPTPQPSQSPHSSIITLTTSSILTSSGVISNAVRGTSPRAPTPTSTAAAPRPLPLLQRNYQPTKVVSVANVGVRGVVGNSAPSQLYYEVPLGSQQHVAHQQQQHHAPQLLHQVQQLPRPLTPYNHNQTAVQVSVVNSGQSVNEARQLATSLAASTILPRPSILRKRDIDGSPSKVGNFLSSGGAVGLSVYREVNSGVSVGSVGGGAPGWEDVPAGARGPGSGSTTMSAASSPPHDDAEPAPPPAPQPPHTPDLSPRKKPRKQM
ncbi:hypothetical protein RR48_07852 [Papilio machaon]|uniref:Uncharacterized protein n=1 Tax=Papilio machaon TaxID=76193 RepID=A0A194QTJ9_PAPMA|nr:hypothetical protein RR48_07852 [Papilio machaon]